jgi:hypothetical protein
VKNSPKEDIPMLLVTAALTVTFFATVNTAFGQTPQNASPVIDQQPLSVPMQSMQMPTGSNMQQPVPVPMQPFQVPVPMQPFQVPVPMQPFQVPVPMQSMQVPTGTNMQQPGPTGFAEQSTGLIVAIATAVGTVASLALAMLNRMGLFKQKEALTEAAKYAITFSNKISEDKENIRTLADVMYQLTPGEQKKALEQAGLNMEKITNEILATEKQLKRLKPMVVAKIGDSRADPDTDPNLPREDTAKSP